MDINRCFEILELDPGASAEEAKQAYKDIADVWHPDRFSHNPRLRQKAERKLKEINVAYETVTSFISRKGDARGKSGAAPKPGTRANGARKAESRPETGTQDKTERAFETGTQILLEVCSYLYTKIRRAVDTKRAKTAEARRGKPQGFKQSAHRSPDRKTRR